MHAHIIVMVLSSSAPSTAGRRAAAIEVGDGTVVFPRHRAGAPDSTHRPVTTGSTSCPDRESRAAGTHPLQHPNHVDLREQHRAGGAESQATPKLADSPLPHRGHARRPAHPPRHRPVSGAGGASGLAQRQSATARSSGPARASCAPTSRPAPAPDPPATVPASYCVRTSSIVSRASSTERVAAPTAQLGLDQAAPTDRHGCFTCNTGGPPPPPARRRGGARHARRRRRAPSRAGRRPPTSSRRG